MDGARPFEAKLIAAEYLREFEALLAQVDLDAVERVVEHLRMARDAEGTIYVAGNGGSAATASHLANDLGKGTKASGRAFVRVMCLSDNVSWLTALANDEGYERAFSGQLENFAGPGDVFVAISASGNSENLIDATDLARRRGVVAVGLLGFDGGVLKDRVDEHLWLPTEQGQYGLVETGHSVLCDILTTCLMKDVAVPDALPGIGTATA
ncbi:MAG: SIS domain-containing protein [Actinomycetota bacterium]|nr:SIS domain-containing protein [Actinomycetota bacterium]